MKTRVDSEIPAIIKNENKKKTALFLFLRDHPYECRKKKMPTDSNNIYDYYNSEHC